MKSTLNYIKENLLQEARSRSSEVTADVISVCAATIYFPIIDQETLFFHIRYEILKKLYVKSGY